MPDADADAAVPPRRAALHTGHRNRWWAALAAVVAVGLGVRLAHVLVVLADVPPGLDAVWYSLQGGSLREGTGYVVPTTLFTGELVPTAGFPPAYPVYQALWQTAFGAGPDSVRLSGLVTAAATIVLTALVARRTIGSRPALLAAAVVALDPALVAVDGSGMSETLSVPLCTAVVLLSCRALSLGLTPWRGIALGAVAGAAALTRQDLLGLLPLLVLPVGLVARSPAAARRATATALALVAATAVVLPWVLRNEREVGSATISTLSPASVLAGSNCDPTYEGESLGSWEFSCVAAAQLPGEPEAVEADHLEAAARRHVEANLDRLPLVVPARVARVWSLWDPRDQIPREVEEARSRRWQQLAWLVNPVILLGGAWGLVRTVRHRPRTTFPLLVPPLLVSATAVISYGNPRFAAIAHPMLAVGLAATAAGLLSAWRRRTGRDPLRWPSPSGAG
ncbi:MAG: glycosyltransferase family 39 protein [Acidimicrobiales bacterium]|nr:glycosyltransferase family 39 protein [Acidimicrobiales bacterium]